MTSFQTSMSVRHNPASMEPHVQMMSISTFVHVRMVMKEQTVKQASLISGHLYSVY